MLAVLPTGGGKTLTFQIPALIKARIYKGLSVVISPLQALMKDHTDSFARKNKNFQVRALSGYLNPIERLEVRREVEEGIVDILYLAPETLRSITTLKLLQTRVIERFIIDEAHCFSAWGHDLRSDYYFIAAFIKKLEESPHQHKISVSCFTATAKKEVLGDIKKYFSDKLGLDLVEFIATNKRENLHYQAVKIEGLPKEIDEKKYEKLIEIIKKENADEKKPTIIYIPQNAKSCKKLAQQLKSDARISGFEIEPFYAKMDADADRISGTRHKSEVLDDFIKDKIDIIVATTAFGMGIDKPNIRLIIHYGQSDSLESYLQESGRGARDKDINANCYVIYDEKEFEGLFLRLILSRVDFGEIRAMATRIKNKAKNRDKIYISHKDFIKNDKKESKIDYKMLINTAILELEKWNLLEKDFNKNIIFATSIDVKKGGMEYIYKILDEKKESLRLDIRQYIVRILSNLIQKKS